MTAEVTYVIRPYRENWRVGDGDDGGAGDGGDNGAGGNGVGAGDGAGDGAGAGGDDLAGALRTIPAKFHVQGEDGTVSAAATIAKFVPAYAEIEAKRHQNETAWRETYDAELAASAPKAPENTDGYTVFTEAPEGVSLPDGTSMEDFNGDPMMGLIKTAMHSAGVTDEGFQTGVKAMLGQISEMATNAKTEMLKSLGDNGAQRIAGARDALVAQVGSEKAQALMSRIHDAGAFQALEHLVQARKAPGDGGDGAPLPAKTRAELEGMMKDPRYWQTREPAYIAEVSKGFQALDAYGKRNR